MHAASAVVGVALQALAASNGGLRIEELAAQVRDHVGLSPKMYVKRLPDVAG